MRGPGRADQTSDARSAPASMPQAARLKLKLLGGLTVLVDDREIDIQARKARAILGYLALNPHQRDTREKLVGMFWSETEEAKARASLRQVLHCLRETLEAQHFYGLNIFRSEIAFEPGTVVTDVELVLESISALEPCDELLDRSNIAETLMSGYEQIDPAFEMWLLVHRENLRQRMLRALEEKLARSDLTSRQTRRLATALLQLDPTHEPACQQVMRACAGSGDIAGALAAYNRLRTVLERDFDVEPSESTQQLMAEIKAGRPDNGTDRSLDRPLQKATGPPAHPGGLQNLVILMGRFDANTDADQRAALRHELIRRLVRFREWSVIDGEAISRPIENAGIDYIVSARMLRNSQNATFWVELKDFATGVVVWSDTYELEAPNFVASFQGFIQQLAAKLNVYVSVDRLRRTVPNLELPANVYDLWLRGQSLVLVLTPETHREAAAIFSKVTKAAPHFSPAYSCLAQLENAHHIVFAGKYRTPQRLERAAALTKQACALDPLDSRAQLCRAWSHAMSGRFELADSIFRLAVDLNDTDPWTVTSAALGHAFGGKHKDAMELAEAALRRVVLPSPVHWTYQCQIRVICGDYEGALTAAERAENATPFLPGWRAAALSALSRDQDAREARRELIANIRQVWFGDPNPSDFAIWHWFANCFPFRDEAQRRKLFGGLN